MDVTFRKLRGFRSIGRRLNSGVASPSKIKYKCKLLVVGGGAGGCNVAWRFSRKLKNSDIIVLEPSKVHYYQPLFTLVAAGIKKLEQSHKPEKLVLPPNIKWLRDHAEEFDPNKNAVYTRLGNQIYYDFMIVAVGLKNDYDTIPGFKPLLDDQSSMVSSIYSPQYCTKTWCNIQQFQGGHAVFTYPKSCGKCSGAAQKIMYLAEDYWRRKKIRGQTNITYNTGGDAIFGVPKYAAALTKIACKKNIAVNCLMELAEVTKKEAVFLDKGGETVTLPYNLLHVAPPMSPPTCLTLCQELITETGYLNVDKYTLQHKRYPNVYGLGDCTCTPNSKTAAAVVHQSYVVEQNLSATMNGKQLVTPYCGYGACPILTSYKTGILAEFLYDKKIWETFPFDQSKERRIIYYMKRDLFPYLYWNKSLKGKWNGTTTVRKILNPFGR